MNIRQWVNAFSVLANLHIFKRRVPIFISWNITFRCNFKCLYCGAEDIKGTELETSEVIRGLNTLWEFGARWITFGGGEPLLREDIGQILGYAKQRGFHIFLSTNGILAKEKAKDIKCVNHVNLSLDGEREVHDIIRGKGSFDKTIEAIHVCRDIGVPVSLLCVLSKHNLNQVSYVLEIASKNRLPIMFHPSTQLLNSSSRKNPICPPVVAYKATINSLIDLKKQGAPIRNSLTGLRHLIHWPDPTSIRCPAEAIMAVIESDGSILACHQTQHRWGECPNIKGITKYQFENLVPPKHCAQCWCAPLVELSLIFSLRPEAVLNAFRLLRNC